MWDLITTLSKKDVKAIVEVHPGISDEEVLHIGIQENLVLLIENHR